MLRIIQIACVAGILLATTAHSAKANESTNYTIQETYPVLGGMATSTIECSNGSGLVTHRVVSDEATADTRIYKMYIRSWYFSLALTPQEEIWVRADALYWNPHGVTSDISVLGFDGPCLQEVPHLEYMGAMKHTYLAFVVH